MNETEFHINQQVRCIDATGAAGRLKHGQVYRIAGFRGDAPSDVWIAGQRHSYRKARFRPLDSQDEWGPGVCQAMQDHADADKDREQEEMALKVYDIILPVGRGFHTLATESQAGLMRLARVLLDQDVRL